MCPEPMCSFIALLKNERQNLSDKVIDLSKALAAPTGVETHSNGRNSSGRNSKWRSADYYDRVSRGAYVHSGFEPDKFGRTGAASLANLDFSNLKQRRYGFPRTRTAEWTVDFDQVSLNARQSPPRILSLRR
jgi:hypothetical protein